MEELLESKSRMIAKNIEKWKENLLDLSKRNQLVNFKYNKKRVLKINNSIYELYTSLIQNEKIKNIEKLDLDFDLLDPIQLKEFQNLTKKLRRERNSVMGEKGLNILYLSLGMLEWKEHENTEEKTYAPLLLLPVELFQANRNTPMEIRLFEDQLIVNPSLQFKFKNEFGVILPEYEEDMEITDYIESAKALVKNIEASEVKESAFLSLLQFSKIALYKDMEQYKDLIETHPIVGNIASSQKAFNNETMDELDSIDPEEPAKESFQVLDADSSQIEAIIAAKKGYSYVLQGPPGTGKSQTISNIIAECLAKGQKVLFVSEKIAALNVVNKRLTQIGLGDYCLELHSNKTNKKSVITNLYDTYLGNNKSSKIDEALLNNVEQIKGRINKYVEALHKSHDKYQENAYTLHGHLASLSEIPTIVFPLPQEISHVRLNEILMKLDQISGEEKSLQIFNESNWNDIEETTWSLAKETQLKENLLQFLALLKSSEELSEFVFEHYDVALNSLKELMDFLTIHDEFEDFKELLVDEWLSTNNFEEQLQFVETYHEIFKKQMNLEQQLLENFTTLDIPRIDNHFESDLFLPMFFESFIDRKSQEVISSINEIQKLMKSIKNEKILDPIFSEVHIDHFKLIDEMNGFFDLLGQGAKIPSIWVDDETRFKQALSNLKNDLALVQAFKEAQNLIVSRVSVEKLEETVISNANALQNVSPSLNEAYSYCYENHAVILEYMSTCIKSLETAGEIFDTLRNKLAINREVNLNNITSLLEIIEIVPDVKVFDKYWFEGVGLRNVERSNNEFFELQKKITNSKNKLVEIWQEEIIEEYENDPDIYNRFLNQYSSFFKRISGRYRTEMKLLTSLLVDDPKPTYEGVLSKLKSVDQHYKLMKQLKENESVYIENMGALYEGLNTEKVDVQNNIKTLHKFKDKCELYGLTTAQMGQILTLKSWFLTDFYDRNNEIKSALAYLRSTYPKIHAHLKGQNNLDTHTFEDVREGLRLKSQLASSLVQPIQSILAVIKGEQTFQEFKEILMEISSYNEALLSYKNNFNGFEQRYGELFDGIDTDWMELSKLVYWWQDVLTNFASKPILTAYKDALTSFALNYSHKNVELIHSRLQQISKDMTRHLNQLEPILSIDLLNQLKMQSFITLEDTLFMYNTRLNTLNPLLESIQMQRKTNWDSVDQLKNDVKLIHNRELILEELKKYSAKNKEITNIGFDLSKEGFDKLKNQLIINEKFLVQLVETGFTYSKVFYQFVTQISVSDIEKFKTINSVKLVLDEKLEKIIANFNSHASLTLDKHREWVQLKFDTIHEIEKVVRIKFVLSQLSDLGLSVMVEKLSDNSNLWNVSPQKLFLKQYYENALDEIYASTPELAEFNKENFERIINLFKLVDKKQFSENANRLNVLLRNNIDEIANDSTLRGQVSLLSKQNERKKGHLPLRRLFVEIPELLLSLKPCILMSPLSVCEFLDPREIQFDLVVFDEASQICPEDAIAPMIRGRNVIMAGDSKQMPPTNFFKATASVDDDYDDDEFIDDDLYESILGLCSDLLPQKTLKWHYRSKHESLIAFSNKHFYSNALNTFPSAENQSNDLGVKLEYVEDGCYDRNGSKSNPVEAERVARLIIEHYKQTDDSLGVIAFSQSQMLAIENKLEVLLREQPEMENRIYNESVEEPFFIKNLENVQGDERDVIFLSTGYAKDQNGVFYHQFGPLNKAGGERRLNVAITRAKKKLVVVSSMKDSEINLSRTQSTGAKLLKNYLEYARTGQMPESVYVNSELIFDSPLEKDIYESIVSLGYEVKTQVGTSGYRIDLAVIHPHQPGKFLVGIECDGASYHSSKTARDRDRLRQQVLEGLGWTIYRIWSQDWFKNKNREIEKIKLMLQGLVEQGE